MIEIPNGDQLINTHDFTISFWVKTNSADKTSGHFVLGLGAFYGIQFEIFGGYDGAKFAIRYELGDGTTAPEDMWFPSDATDNTNGGWQGWDFAKPIPKDQMVAMLKDNWLQVVYTYNSAERKGTLYYNGEKMKSFDFDLWPDNDPKRTVVGLKYGGVAPEVVNELAFGFIQSRAGTLWDNESWGGYDFPGANHFKGLLDDVRIFHKALTATEINLMYNSEKP
ncbi:MAG: LamG domain-containing protein [Bacteroidales bacterium]